MGRQPLTIMGSPHHQFIPASRSSRLGFARQVWTPVATAFTNRVVVRMTASSRKMNRARGPIS